MAQRTWFITGVSSGQVVRMITPVNVVRRQR
jgi:hypothetical protein